MARRPPRGTSAALWLALLALACGDRVHAARGVVREVEPELGQVVIEHEEIPGLMPAMTMNFEVTDPELLAALEPGQAIDFRVAFDGKSYRVTAFEVRGRAEGEAGASIAAARDVGEPAPDLSLVDQEGRPFELARLRGRAVLVDFIYTRCPGPCPILTGVHVDLQRALPPELRARTWFVSVSIDPEHDTPEALRAYAAARGADLSDWSFLTGAPEAVAEVLSAWGVGSLRQPDGELAHLVATFLIDAEGRIARRFIGLDHDVAELRRGLEAVQ